MHEGVKAEVFKKHRVAGGGYKKNVKCPNCLSVDRSRLLYLFFELRTKVFLQPTKILHISPNFEIARFLSQHKTVDQTVGALEPEHFTEFNGVKIDIQKIDFADDMFDVLICCHVIEHVDDDLAAMRELYRILKPKGFAVLQVPLAIDLKTTIEDKSATTNKLRKIAHGQNDHVRLYGLDYLDKLRSVGFRVVRDNPYDNKWLSEEELRKHALDRIEDVIVCYKD